MISLHLTLPHPLAPLDLSLPSSTSVSTILPSYSTLPESSLSSLYLRTRSQPLLSSSATLGSLLSGSPSLEHEDSDDEEVGHIDVQVACRMLGGKGGFGAMLRATGGKMSSQKASNNDSCRDLSGRRLSTIKEAKKAAELLELEATHNKKTAEAARAKLDALERQLGIAPSSSSSSRAPPPTIGDVDPSSFSTEAGPSSNAEAGSSRTKLTQQDLVELAGKRHKFEDNAFFEESREIKENVRSAVSAGLLKKKKKAKLTSAGKSTTTTSEEKAPATVAV